MRLSLFLTLYSSASHSSFITRFRGCPFLMIKQTTHQADDCTTLDAQGTVRLSRSSIARSVQFQNSNFFTFFCAGSDRQGQGGAGSGGAGARLRVQPPVRLRPAAGAAAGAHARFGRVALLSQHGHSCCCGHVHRTCCCSGANWTNQLLVCQLHLAWEVRLMV